jgi:hypothetical protein
MPRKVVFESLAYKDDPDPTFRDDISQEIRGLMKAPISDRRVLFHFSTLYQQVRLAQEPLDDLGWRAMFRCQQIENA